MTRPLWTPEASATLRRLVADGLTDAEIAAALGVSPWTIRHRRGALGLLRREPPAAPVSDEAIRGAHGEGLDNGALAARLGLTRRTVQERLSRMRIRANRPIPPLK